jgi:F-type H+-transporting ATPase subunit b
MIREAGRERDEIMKRSLAEAEQIKADITAKARSEGEALLKRAKEQIDREKALAILDLRAQVADIAVLAASKIVTSSLTPEAQRKLVSETIEKLPKAIQS